MTDLIGKRVEIYTAFGESEPATVVAMKANGFLVVETDDGDRLIGNQYEEIG